MGNSKVVVDTSIFIEYLRAKNKESTVLFNIPNDSILFVSTVTLFELYAGATSDQKYNDVKNLTESLPILPLSTEIALRAARIFLDLKKRNQLIDFCDIFIGATAVVNNLSLLTMNKDHFQRIDGLFVL